jgi:hypothetical protein
MHKQEPGLHMATKYDGGHYRSQLIPLTATSQAVKKCRAEPEFLNFRSLRIDSKEPIPPGCVAWRAGTTTLFLLGS